MLEQLLCYACCKVDGRLFVLSSVVAVNTRSRNILFARTSLQVVYDKGR